MAHGRTCVFVSIFLPCRQASWHLAAVFLSFNPDSKEADRIEARYAHSISALGQANVSTLCFHFLQSTSTDDP